MYSIQQNRRFNRLFTNTKAKNSLGLKGFIAFLTLMGLQPYLPVKHLSGVKLKAQTTPLSSNIAAASIRGTIVDATTKDALAGANIWISPNENKMDIMTGFSTNILGEFEGQWSLPTTKTNADYTLHISYLGYKAWQLPLEEALSESNQYAQDAAGRWIIALTANSELEELIIQAVRASQEDPVTESTLSSTVLNRVYQGQQPVFLLERLSPSVLTYNESGTQMANYGGMRLRGISQERINMTLNGIPLNDMIDHGVFFSNFTDLGANFESIQIQRGVGTAPNGLASYAGSVNFETVRLKDRPQGGALNVGVGSFNTYRLNGNVSTGLVDDRWSMYGSYSSLASDGFKDNTSTSAYSFFLSGAYFGEKHLFKFNAFDANAKNGLGYLAAARSDIVGNPRINYLNPNDTDDFGQRLFQLQHSTKLNAQSSLQSSLYYGSAGGDYFYSYDDGTGTLAQINYPLYNDQYGLMSTYFVEQDGWKWSTGLHAYRFDRINEESVTPNFQAPYYRETSNKQEISWFGSAEWTLEQLSIQADLQLRATSLQVNPDYDFIGIASQGDLNYNWTFLNPKVGIYWKHHPGLSSYVSLGRMGREPTKIDIFGGFSLTADNFESASNTQFGPEYVNNLETGLRWNRPQVSVSGNLFYMDFVDEIAPIGEVLAFGVQKRDNIANSNRYGIEVEWLSILKPLASGAEFGTAAGQDGSTRKESGIGLSWEGSLSWIRGNIDSFSTADGMTYLDRTPIFTPEWLINQALVVDLSRRWNVRVEGRYVSESYMELTNNSEFKVPDYTLLNGQLSWVGARMDVRVDIHNLLDVQYYSLGSPVDLDFDGSYDEPGYLANAGRSILVSTRLKF